MIDYQIENCKTKHRIYIYRLFFYPTFNFKYTASPNVIKYLYSQSKIIQSNTGDRQPHIDFESRILSSIHNAILFIEPKDR